MSELRNTIYQNSPHFLNISSCLTILSEQFNNSLPVVDPGG